MEWLVYILLGCVIVQQIQLILINSNEKTFLDMFKTNMRMDKLLNERLNLFWSYISRVKNKAYNEEGNGSINPSEADTGLCHEVSRQK